jgi:demethylmenaquinone methyltransferase/2-methoxy-6-polyprenyl-1,4-benzoquinol methylase
MPTSAVRTRDQFAQQLFTPLPAHYDRLAALLSLGQDRRWRRAMVDHIVAARPRRILDVACGPAGVSLQMVERTDAGIVGIDLTEAMVRRGLRNVENAGSGDRIALAVGRGQQIPFADATFDGVTFTYLLRYVEDPPAALAEMARVLKPGGAMASLEFLVPPRPFWRFWWLGYTRLVLPAAGWLAGGAAWYRVGRFLGPSISGHYHRYPVDWTVRAWERAGLRKVGTRVMSLGGGLVMWGERADG